MSAKVVEKIGVENVNHPGQIRYVDAARYAAMRRAFSRILPKRSPGLTADEIRERLLAHLPADLFQQGAGPGWWAKTVQLDLEAKGLIAREAARPLRWRLTTPRPRASRPGPLR
jgi:hypothetical protein